MEKYKKRGYAEIISAVSIWGINSGIIVKKITTPAFYLYPVASLFGLIMVTLALFKNRTLSQIKSVDRKLTLVIVEVLIFLNNGSF